MPMPTLEDAEELRACSPTCDAAIARQDEDEIRSHPPEGRGTGLLPRKTS